jgi:hypothetical protein
MLCGKLRIKPTLRLPPLPPPRPGRWSWPREDPCRLEGRSVAIRTTRVRADLGFPKIAVQVAPCPRPTGHCSAPTTSIAHFHHPHRPHVFGCTGCQAGSIRAASQGGALQRLQLRGCVPGARLDVGPDAMAGRLLPTVAEGHPEGPLRLHLQDGLRHRAYPPLAATDAVLTSPTRSVLDRLVRWPPPSLLSSANASHRLVYDLQEERHCALKVVRASPSFSQAALDEIQLSKHINQLAAETNHVSLAFHARDASGSPLACAAGQTQPRHLPRPFPPLLTQVRFQISFS